MFKMRIKAEEVLLVLVAPQMEVLILQVSARRPILSLLKPHSKQRQRSLIDQNLTLYEATIFELQIKFQR